MWVGPELRDALKRVERLRIEHPDPDQYDDVWNKAIMAACQAITEVITRPTQTLLRKI